MRIGFSSSVVMPKLWNSSQSLGRCCTSGEMICFGAFSSVSALATTKALRPVSGSKGTCATWLLSSSSMSTPPCASASWSARGNACESVIEK